MLIHGWQWRGMQADPEAAIDEDDRRHD